MAKTRKLIAEDLKLVDVVIELLDARIPLSSKNPDIDNMTRGKPRIVAFNKCDLADEAVNKEWERWYNRNGYTCIFINAITGKGLSDIKKELLLIKKAKIESQAAKGRVGGSVRTIVLGIPNVGKSTLINKFAGRAAAPTEDRPGVTRAKQWVRLEGGIELLDTPGILWPKFDDRRVGLNLSFTGAIKDDILDTVEIASELVGVLRETYPEQLRDRYGVDVEAYGGIELLEQIGKKRGCIVAGGKIDLNRTSAIVLDEFRAGRIGRISLERPEV